MNLTYSKRLGLLAVAGGLAILLVLVRLYELQIVNGSQALAQLYALANSERPIPGERGRILDSDGALLAADGPGFDLMVVTAGWMGELHRCRECTHEIFLREQDRDSFKRCPQCKKPSDKVLERLGARCNLEPLAQLLGTDRESLRERLDKLSAKVTKRVEDELGAIKTPMSPRRLRNLKHQLRRDYGWQPVVFQRDVPYEVAREVTLHPDRNPPFRIRESRTRRNFGGEPFAHLIGRVPDLVVIAAGRPYGRGAGLESQFDIELRGEPGMVRKAADPDNRNKLKVVERLNPVPGLDVRLTMAKQDQDAAQAALGSRAGAFVVINAETGAVLALTSAPTFDPDRFAQAVQEAIADPSLPKRFFARAVRGTYPPGSTLKPFTGLAALTAGLLTPEDTIQCDKHYVLRGTTITGAMTCMDTHGPTKLRQALVQSCNIYFQTIVDRLEAAGKEQHFEDTLRRFGLGEPTGLNIEPRDIRKHTLRLRPGNRQASLSVRIQAGIGQGRVTLTPTQLARGYAGIATGYLPDLRVVESVGNTPTPIVRQRIAVEARHLKVIREGLRAKTRNDDSLNHDVFASFRVATKTGTAQQRDKTTYFAWLAGFADRNKTRPPIAFAMVIEDSDLYGGRECGNRVAEFLAQFYGTHSE